MKMMIAAVALVPLMPLMRKSQNRKQGKQGEFKSDSLNNDTVFLRYCCASGILMGLTVAP